LLSELFMQIPLRCVLIIAGLTLYGLLLLPVLVPLWILLRTLQVSFLFGQRQELASSMGIATTETCGSDGCRLYGWWNWEIATLKAEQQTVEQYLKWKRYVEAQSTVSVGERI
jgi:hypothetical protein